MPSTWTFCERVSLEYESRWKSKSRTLTIFKLVATVSEGQEAVHCKTGRRTDSLDPWTEDVINAPEEINIFHVNRRLPKGDGIYIVGKVNGVDVHFTADTGATSTIISHKIYEKLSEENRPKLSGNYQLRGAGGTRIRVYGSRNFKIQLGTLEISKRIMVAGVEDDVLLGIDILQNDKGGQADILLSKGIINLYGHSIPCIQQGLKNSQIILRAAEKFEIPAMSEMIIEAFIVREDDEKMTSYETSCLSHRKNF